MNFGERTTDGDGDLDDRAGSPMLGLILLFGMVIMGSMLVFVAAGPLIDALEGESERERAFSYMSQTDQSIATATISDTPQPLGVPPDADLSVTEDGEIEFAWYNDSEDPWKPSPENSVTLGSLEYELNDRTIAHQGGAIWEHTGSDVRAEQSPDIGFASDGSLQLNLMQITSEAGDKSPTQIRNNPETAMKSAEDLDRVTEHSNGDNFAIKIKSKYAKGWEQHFRSEKENVDQWNITVKGPDEVGEDTVVVRIEDIGDPESQPHFLIENDNGLTPKDEGGPHMITNNVVNYGTGFYLNTTLKNYGASEEQVTATLSIRDESGNLVEEREITSDDPIDPGGEIRTANHKKWKGGNHFFRTGNGANTIDVEPGNEYQYDVETDPGGDTLDNRGTFIVVDDQPTFTIDDIEFNDPVKPGEPLTAQVNVTNEGTVVNQQFVGLEGFGGGLVDVQPIELEGGENGTVELEWGAVEEPSPGDQVTIATETDSNTTDADDLIDFVELNDVSVAESVEQGESVDIEADVERISGDPDGYVARLVDPDDDIVDTVAYGEDGWTDRDGTINFDEYETDDDEITHRVTVEIYDETADFVDDEMEAVVVIERDGPVCSEVNYEGSGTSDDPYLIHNVDQLQCINDDLDAHYELVDDIDAHGTEYWNPQVTDTEEITETKTSDGGDIEEGDRFILSETPVLKGSIEADTDSGFWGTNPEVQIVDPANGIVEVTTEPTCGFGCGDLSEITFEYSAVTETDPQGFEPIGPEGHDSITIPQDGPWDTFDGEFDGNGNTIEGLYIDRPKEDYVGLFGATGYPFNDKAVGEGSTVENVVLEDIHVVGNMYVGGLAGQAGGKVRNARAEGYVEADKQLVGGLIGIGAHADIDNRIVADVEVVGGDVPSGYYGIRRGNAKGIGGLIGRAAWGTEIAVGYSQGEVTGPVNVGGVMGSSSLVDSQFEELYSTAEVSATEGDAGAIVGIVQSDGDRFEDDIYWDQTITPSAFGEAEQVSGNSLTSMNIWEVEMTDWQGRSTDDMQGLNVTEPEKMGNLDFEADDEDNPWVAIPDDYPRFTWELEAEGIFEVEIDGVEDSVTAGENATVTATITSRYRARTESNETQMITLRAVSQDEEANNRTVATKEVTLQSLLEEDDEEQITLEWDTSFDDDGNWDLIVQSQDRDAEAEIEISEADIVEDRFGDSDNSEDEVSNEIAIDIGIDAVSIG